MISMIPYETLEQTRREHHESLQFCRRIQSGLLGSIETPRLINYAEWFLDQYLKPHLEMETAVVFSILGEENVRVKRVLANHRRLMRLFKWEKKPEIALNLIEEELTTFIRFEERILYQEILARANPKQMMEIEGLHLKLSFREEDWEDRFWESLRGSE